MSEAKPFPPSPFKGPRPLEYGDKIYGRTREIYDLYNQLCANRIVVLHSPSGAGKSSMVQAGLLPRLEAQFDVWGPARVHESSDDPQSNRYVSSLIRSLESSAGAHLSSLDLVSYATQRHTHTDPVVLVLDQFEEIITADQLNRKAIEGFFEQLGTLLHDPSFFALFMIREDYLAALEAYRGFIPTQFNNRFRIDLLTVKVAMDAISNPPKSANYPFDDAAVDQLARDLASIQVLQADGSTLAQVGDFIEPVYLQVACSDLWSKLATDKNRNKLSIDLEDVRALGNVSNALSSYYSSRLTGLAGQDHRLEGEIREWFGEKLITPANRRGQVLKGQTATDGLDNAIVQELSKALLIRRDVRAGSEWFELAHDRLIPAVLRNNEEWFDSQLPLQRAARSWIRSDRQDRFLVVGLELAQLKKDLDFVSLQPDSRAFLDACDTADAEQIQRERSQHRLNQLTTIVVVLLGLLGPPGIAAFSWAIKTLLENSISTSEGLGILSIMLFLFSLFLGAAAFVGLQLFRWYSGMKLLLSRLARKRRIDPSLQSSTLGNARSSYSPNRSGSSEVLDQWESITLEFAPYWILLIVAGGDKVITPMEFNAHSNFLSRKGISQRLLILDQFFADTRPALVGLADVVAIYRAKKSAAEFKKFGSSMILLAREISQRDSAAASSVKFVQELFAANFDSGVFQSLTNYYGDASVARNLDKFGVFKPITRNYILASMLPTCIAFLFFGASSEFIRWIFPITQLALVIGWHTGLLPLHSSKNASVWHFVITSGLPIVVFVLVNALVFGAPYLWFVILPTTLIQILILSRVSKGTLCSTCKRWASKNNKGFYIASQDPNFESGLRHHLEDGDIEFLDSARLSSPTDPNFNQSYFVTLLSCATCKDFHALSITRTDAKTKAQVKIIDRLLINSKQAEWLNSRMA